MLPRFVVFDTETTGLSNSARVLELGMVFCEDGVIVDSYCQRFCPAGVDWDSSDVKIAMSVNKIDRKELEGEPDFMDVADHIDMLLSRFPLWVGHNISFDIRMLSNEFLRLGRAISNISTVARFCTKEHSRLLNKKEKHHLANLAARYGVTLYDAHTAVGDATATAEIFIKMYEEGKFPNMFAQRLEKIAAAEKRRT